MKNVKNIMAFLALLSATTVALEAQEEVSTISVASSSINTSFDESNAIKNIDAPANKLLACPMNPQFKTYERELDSLSANTVYALDESTKGRVPQIYNLIYSITKELATKAKIDMPGMAISTVMDNEFYNAKAEIQLSVLTETMTERVGGVVQSVKTEQKSIANHTLIIGLGTLKLLLLHPRGTDLLTAIIAHEVGHMRHNHVYPTIVAEKEADRDAVNFLGIDMADFLVTAINMITLAGHLSANLKVNAAVFNLPTSKTEDFVMPLINGLIQEHPALGELGQSSSHSKFGYVVLKILEDSLKTMSVLKTLTSPANYMTHLVNTVYDKLLDSCINQERLFGDNCDLIDEKMARVEQYTSQLFSKITHPNPLDRMEHIKACKAALATSA